MTNNYSKKVSLGIVIPTFNSSNTIKKCITSFLYQLSKEDTIFIIDDRSTDNTKEVIERISDCRIKLIINPSKGPNSARNKAIEISENDYLMFIDSDDYLEKNVILNLKNNIFKYSPEILVMGYAFKDKKKFFKSSSLRKNIFIQNKEEILEYAFLSPHYASVCWNKVIAMKLLKDNSKIRFIDDNVHGRDSIFVKELAIKTKNLLFISGIQYISSITLNSFSRKYSIKNVYSAVDCIAKLNNFIIDKKAPIDLVYKSILKLMLYTIFYSAIRLDYKSFKKVSFIIYSELIKIQRKYYKDIKKNNLKIFLNNLFIKKNFKFSFFTLISFRFAKKINLLIDY